MRCRWGRIFLPLTVLLLAGCFRQASDLSEAGGVQSIPLASPVAEEDAAPQGGPPITILPSPTRLRVTTPDPSGPGAQAASATPAGSFITPLSPRGPITPDTATPTPVISARNTPSGLVTPTALPGGASEDGCSYAIQSGDTLFRLAIANNITLAELQAANPDAGEILSIGQVINIPGCGAGTDDTVQQQAAQPATTTPTITTAEGTLYTVQAGDTLFTIAQQFGVTVQAIAEANDLANPNTLSIGQQLIIPPGNNP